MSSNHRIIITATSAALLLSFASFSNAQNEVVGEAVQATEVAIEAIDAPEAPVAVELIPPTIEQGVAAFTAEEPEYNFLGTGDVAYMDFMDLEGNHYTNETLAGKIVIVDNWAAWCQPCVAAMPRIEEMYETYSEQGVVFLGVNFDETMEELTGAIEELEIAMPQVFDGQRALAYHWGPKMLPNVHIIGPDGTIIWAGKPSEMEVPFHLALRDHMPDLYDEAAHSEAVTAFEEQQRIAAEERAIAEAEAAVLAAAAWKVGDTPEFAFTTIDGHNMTAESLRGKVVILDFWATWCGPCMASMPHMIELYAEHADQGVEVIGINYDAELEPIQETIAELGMNWPQVHDTERKLGNAFAVQAIPSIWILSPEGEILWTGHPQQMDEAFEAAIEQLDQ